MILTIDEIQGRIDAAKNRIIRAQDAANACSCSIERAGHQKRVTKLVCHLGAHLARAHLMANDPFSEERRANMCVLR